MFYNTHAYLATKLYKSKNSLLLVGSILPDIAIMKVIPWQGGLHGTTERDNFFKFINATYPKYLNLAKGVIAHNIVDDFTHKDYSGGTGYAFQNNEKLVNKIVKYYAVGNERATVLAHNYIESAVDIYLLKDHLDIQDKLKDAIENTDKQKLAEILGEYFKIKPEKFDKALTDFFGIIGKDDYSKKENWVKFWGEFAELLELKSVDESIREELINKSLEIVKNTYKDFLDYSLIEGAKSIKYSQ